jgi:hypothetical protein
MLVTKAAVILKLKFWVTQLLYLMVGDMVFVSNRIIGIWRWKFVAVNYNISILNIECHSTMLFGLTPKDWS